MTYALIPARGGSKGISKKNIRMLGGYPLIAYTIAASKLSKKITRTIVSTDSEEIADIAKGCNAEVPFLRPSRFSGDRSPDIEYVLHAIDWFEHREGNLPEYFVLLRPTTPLRDPLIIDSAIEGIKGRPDATSLRSAHPAAESPFKWFLKDKKGYFTGMERKYPNDYINNPRQCFPEVYIPNGYVDIVKTSFIKKTRKLFGNRMLAFITPVCHEVDRMEDFEFLEWELEKKGSPLFDYLRKNFSAQKQDVKLEV